MRARRCVLLFSRSPREEARRKGLPGAEPLFALAAERVAAAAQAQGLDLLVVGEAAAGGPEGGGLLQRGRTFGERLGNAFADAWSLGYRQVLVVPGDVPGLATAAFSACVTALDEGRVVLGPSPDGGIYLLGMPGVRPELLQGVRWQTAAVLGDLLARVGADACVLAPLSDLDSPRGLPRLARESAHDPWVLSLLRALQRTRTVPGPIVDGPPARPRFVDVDPLRGPPTPA